MKILFISIVFVLVGAIVAFVAYVIREDRWFAQHCTEPTGRTKHVTSWVQTVHSGKTTIVIAHPAKNVPCYLCDTGEELCQ